ncbi:MAG: hypothetical protein HY694_13135 [Deltaproteobacteria bacterium]|nr:hypothetical protein [Deltaproteobacteria bacterium]
MSDALLVAPLEQKPEQICAAHTLSPPDRQDLALQVLSRSQPVSQLAREHGVSRKFLYHQADKAHQALEEAFDPPQDEADVLFFLPVTRAWLRSFVLALIFICHASFRGVVELFRDLLDTPISIGTVHNIVGQAVVEARRVNAREDLSAIFIGAHDEIFQSNQPVLVGCDAVSTYCYLLAQEEGRDATTWGVHLLELEQRGLRPDHIVADFGKGLRAGQAQAWPEVPCWGDHFHIVQELVQTATCLENRALAAMAFRQKLEQKMATARRKTQGQTLSKRLAGARKAEVQTVELTQDVAILVQWMQADILSVVGPDVSTRAQLYDFVVEELRKRQPQAPHRIEPVVRKLENGKADLLAFAVHLESRLALLSQEFHVAFEVVRRLFEVQGIAQTDPKRWQQEALVRQQLGSRFYPLQKAIFQIVDSTLRASSVVENLNSRLRNYFFLRKYLGKDYLDLLRFFLNHRRFLRSEYPERGGRSPAEVLTGRTHPHWLSLLGFQLFKKAA